MQAKTVEYAVRCLTSTALACLLATPLGAQASDPSQADHSATSRCAPEDRLRWRGGTLRLENDVLAGTDRNYTNGVAITAVSHDVAGRLRPDCLPLPLGLYVGLLRWLDVPFLDREDSASSTQNLVVRLNQAIYTPEDGKRRDLIRSDRPYAGLLSLGLAWNRRYRPERSAIERLDTHELALGVIGPASLAEQTQTFVHDLRGIDTFNGWDNQLRNEPAFQFSIERKLRRAMPGAFSAGWSGDAIGSYGLRVGNIETAASAGIEFRAGWNLPNDFGSYPIRPGAENRPPSAALAASGPSSASPRRAGAHVFVNLEAKAAAWDFSLDGNLFRSSHRVDRRPLVAQAAIGISTQRIIAGRGMRLALMRVWRTREFDSQPDPHSFGSIALSLEF